MARRFVRSRSRNDERSGWLKVNSEGKGEVILGVKLGQQLQGEKSNESTELGPINSGEQSKADVYDILPDDYFEKTITSGIFHRYI